MKTFIIHVLSYNYHSYSPTQWVEKVTAASLKEAKSNFHKTHGKTDQIEEIHEI